MPIRVTGSLGEPTIGQGQPLGVTMGFKVDGHDDAKMLLERSLDSIAEVQQAVKDGARMLQAQMVHNVSGSEVTWSGYTFIIRRRTGKLARSIKISEVVPLSATVTADAEYASYIEGGARRHDLKPSLMGKTVPVPIKSGLAASVMTFMMAGRSKGTGQLTKRGSKLLPDGDINFSDIKAMGGRINGTLASTGRNMGGGQLILFRRVGPNTDPNAFVIPAQPPRPFARAAAAYVEPRFAKAVEDALTKFYEGGPKQP